MNRLRFCLLFFLAASSLKAMAADAQAILVWAQFDGQHHIVSSSLNDQQWSTPAVIHSSDNVIVTPALAKNNEGQTIMVWSEQQQGRMEILQSQLSKQSQIWSEPELLIDEGSENLNPNIVNDGQGGLWLFWSGNDDGLDDIYYKQKRVNEREWSETKQLNEPNEVPDYKPVAELDDFGDILVRWQTYDFLAGQYIEAQETIVVDQKVAYNRSQADGDIKLEDILLPDFLPTDSSVSLLFPNNVAAQSIRLD